MDFFSRSDLPVYGVKHHESHAYSTYFTSPFEEAAILVADGSGDIIDGRNTGQHRIDRRDDDNIFSPFYPARPIWLRDFRTLQKGNFGVELGYSVIYNQNGAEDGLRVVRHYYPGDRYLERFNTVLQVDDGLIKSLVSYDSKGLNKDSISNDF